MKSVEALLEHIDIILFDLKAEARYYEQLRYLEEGDYPEDLATINAQITGLANIVKDILEAEAIRGILNDN